MVLMKKQDRDTIIAMREQCGQERDVNVKQVECGFVIQSVTRFFTIDNGGPVEVAVIQDTCVAVTSHEAALVASNFIKHGEFWPDDMKVDTTNENADMLTDDDHVTGDDPVLDALMPE